MAAPMTESVIQQLRGMIQSGELRPGDRLPPEQQLAVQVGTSKNTVREAVRALVSARILDVRRGDGTYVTSLQPDLLLEGIGAAVELMQDDAIIELVEVRRVLESAVTGMAAERISEQTLEDLAECLDQMRIAGADQDQLILHDARFHAIVADAAGNGTLRSMLAGVSGVGLRGRAWRAIVDHDAAGRAIAEHERILEALRLRDRELAESAARVHVASTQSWLRYLLETSGAAATGPGPRKARGPARPGR